MKREYDILTALKPNYGKVPALQSFIVKDGKAPKGAPSNLMERVEVLS